MRSPEPPSRVLERVDELGKLFAENPRLPSAWKTTATAPWYSEDASQSMNFDFDPNTEKELNALAEAMGKDPSVLLRELIHRAAAARKAKRRGKAASPREADPACEPSQTALGRKLRALSKKYIEGGGKLLTVEEINVEVAENRGER